MTRGLRVLTVALASIACVPSAWAEDAVLRTIPSRVIPVPRTVSPAMQKLLAGEPVQWPKPFTTIEEWKSYQKSLSSPETLNSIQRLRDQYGVTVTSEVIGGVSCYRITPKMVPTRNRKRLLVNLHHGGFIGGTGESGLTEAIVMAGIAKYQVIAVDYRLLPDHPFPAAMDDAVAVWKEITQSTKPGNIAVFGSSVGGGLVLSLVQRATREHLPLPGAVMSGTPDSDLSKTGDTYYTNDGVDNLFGYNDFWEALAKMYANGRSLTDPLISPIYGSFEGFPPTFLVSGTRDLYLSNTVRVHRQLLRAGVPTQLVVAEAEYHGAYLLAAFVNAPEVAELYSYIAQFFDDHLGY